MPIWYGKLISISLHMPYSVIRLFTINRFVMQVSEQNLKDIELMMREVNENLQFYFTRMSPSHFVEVGKINSRLPLDIINGVILLCVSAIGSPDSFVKGMEKVVPNLHSVL